MANKISTVCIPLQKSAFFSFRKSKDEAIATILSPRYGFVAAPADLVANEGEAKKLLYELSRFPLNKENVYEVDAEKKLVIQSMSQNGLGLFLDKAPDDYVAPELLEPAFFKGKGGVRREFYLDSVKIVPSTKHLIDGIYIRDKKAAAFVQELISQKETWTEKVGRFFSRKRNDYRLVYHNYKDAETGEIKLRADCIVLIQRRNGDKAVVLAHKLPKTFMGRLALEFVLEDYPRRVVVSGENVKYSPKLYEGIYQKTKVKNSPLKGIRNDWPFDLPKVETFIELREPKLSLKEKLKLFSEAAKKDTTFGLSAIGELFYNSGKGFGEGVLGYAILTMAQNELKVAALCAWLLKTQLVFYLYANGRASTQVERLESKERVGEALNKLFPLWEMGAQKKSTQTLIQRYTKISIAYLAAQAIHFNLFPPIFKAWAGPLDPIAMAGVFVAGYLAVEFITVMADAYDLRNEFKITENRLRFNPKLPEYEKSFWTIHGIQTNLAMMLNQLSLGAGFGLFSLAAFLLPGYATAAGIALGAVSLILCGCRFILPIFGREEKTRLEVKLPDCLRKARTLEINKNLYIKLGPDPKAEIIEQEDKNRLIIPDFDKSGVKLNVANFDSITIKKSWLSKLIPFKFAKRYYAIVKTKDRSDPAVIFKFYGQESPSVEEIKKRFIEERK